MPDEFARVVAAVRGGQPQRVAVRDLVRWFGFERRGAKVNRYIRAVMTQEGVCSTPELEAAFPDGDLVFGPVGPVVQVAPPSPRPPPSPPRELPHPFAVFRQAISAQHSVSRRVGTRLDAIERLVAYLVFAELAWLREAGAGVYPVGVRSSLREVLPDGGDVGQPLSFGTWVDCARKLAGLVPAGSPVQRAAAAFGPLAPRVSNEIVSLRNKSKHAGILPEGWYREAEPPIEAVEKELERALGPLLDLDLFSVSRTHPGDREAYRYDVRVLHGISRHFPLQSRETSAKLVPSWAYLDVPGTSPLRLAPGVFCQEDAETEEVHLFFARTLALDSGQKLSLQAIQGPNETKQLLPP